MIRMRWEMGLQLSFWGREHFLYIIHPTHEGQNSSKKKGEENNTPQIFFLLFSFHNTHNRRGQRLVLLSLLIHFFGLFFTLKFLISQPDQLFWLFMCTFFLFFMFGLTTLRLFLLLFFCFFFVVGSFFHIFSLLSYLHFYPDATRHHTPHRHFFLTRLFFKRPGRPERPERPGRPERLFWDQKQETKKLMN